MSLFTEEELKKQLCAARGEIEEKSAALLRWEKLYNEMEVRVTTAEAMMQARIAPFLAISEKTEADLAIAIKLLQISRENFTIVDQEDVNKLCKMDEFLKEKQ